MKKKIKVRKKQRIIKMKIHLMKKIKKEMKIIYLKIIKKVKN